MKYDEALQKFLAKLSHHSSLKNFQIFSSLLSTPTVQICIEKDYYKLEDFEVFINNPLVCIALTSSNALSCFEQKYMAPKDLLEVMQATPKPMLGFILTSLPAQLYYANHHSIKDFVGGLVLNGVKSDENNNPNLWISEQELVGQCSKILTDYSSQKLF